MDATAGKCWSGESALCGDVLHIFIRSLSSGVGAGAFARISRFLADSHNRVEMVPLPQAAGRLVSRIEEGGIPALLSHHRCNTTTQLSLLHPLVVALRL
jgi:hypothetical protein